MANPGDKEYRRRNVVLGDDMDGERDLALWAMDWHGGQGSMVYSLASTAYAGDFVSPSMIDAAVSELEADLSKVKKDKSAQGKKDRKDLEALIGELDAKARFSSEFTIREYTGEDKDDGYETWLEVEENPKKGGGAILAVKGVPKSRKKDGTMSEKARKDIMRRAISGK